MSSATSSTSFVVLDQSMMRDPGLAATLAKLNRDGHRVALPVTSFGEMLKSSRWRFTMERSLATLALSPGTVVGLKTRNAILWEELETAAPCAEFIDQDWTRRLRDVLVQLRRGNASALQHFEHGRQQLPASPFYSPENSDLFFREGQRVLREVLTDDDLKLLRRGDFQPLLDRVSGPAGDVMIYNALASVVDDTIANALAGSVSFTSTFILTNLLRHADWLGRGGADSLSPESVRNDRLDESYIAFAALGDGLLTNETAMRRRYGWMRRIVERRLARLG